MTEVSNYSFLYLVGQASKPASLYCTLGLQKVWFDFHFLPFPDIPFKNIQLVQMSLGLFPISVSDKIK